MKTRNTNYLALCMAQPADWLLACLREPSKRMTARHFALIRIALRRKGVQS